MGILLNVEDLSRYPKIIPIIISIAKRCSYNSPTQRSQPIHPYPTQSTYSSRAKNGQTEQDQNEGIRFTTQNCEFMNNLFRKNFCRTMKKFRNCIKNVAKPQH